MTVTDLLPLSKIILSPKEDSNKVCFPMFGQCELLLFGSTWAFLYPFFRGYFPPCDGLNLITFSYRCFLSFFVPFSDF